MKKLMAFLLILALLLPQNAAASSDVSEYLQRAQADGVIFGDENGNLQGDKEATRAEFLAIAERFWHLSGGENVFSDVNESDWFCKSIASAKFCGIFAGTPEGEAKPYEIIKTEDAVSIIGRYYNATSHKGKYVGLSPYAEDYFGYAFENGLFSRWKHLPTPKQGITKGEIVSLFYGYKERNEQEDCFAEGYPKLSQRQQFGYLSVEIVTKNDCDISCAMQENNSDAYRWTEIPETMHAGEIKTIRITADMGKTYDLYVKAVSRENGLSRISSFADVAPLSFIKGNGSQAQPYVIYTEKQLKQIGIFPDQAYVLGADIAISEKWEPIKTLKGSLDGAGYRISGIKISGGSQKAGLFAELDGGTVKNLTVDADIKVKEIAGVIAGENESGNIEGCTVTGSVEVTGGNAGGICGINRGKIEGCLSCVYLVKSGSFAGGIAGQNRARIENCLSAAETVTSDMYSGGIAGTNNGGYIKGCVAADIAVYNTMTYNGGKISTNRGDGMMENNYSFADMVSNSARTETNSSSRNGLELSWDTITDMEFYRDIGWDIKKWKQAKNGFLLPCPKNAAEPILESGKTVYFPKEIATADGLMEISKNGKGHYVLVRNITLKAPWKTIDIKEGFSGTLDGGGYTIYNLTLKGESGMFSNITGGTVKNLKLMRVNAELDANGGVIAACNYGYIENCTVSGAVYAPKAEKIGIIAGENNGRIENCTASAALTAVGDDAVVGGICAVNSGVLEKCAFSGEINLSAETAAVGGICGVDTDGYISESAAKLTVYAEGADAVLGGICAVSDGTQVYKCAAFGDAACGSNDAVAGGICGEAVGATIYNCLSQTKINVNSEKAAVGGICGEAVASNIQNTYSSGEISAVGRGSVAGGICGTAADSFIMQNVALNSAVISGKTANAIVGETENCDISDNYSAQKMRKNANAVRNGEKNGITKSETELLKAEFYLKPLSEKGLLGWDDTAWTKKNDCAVPILTDTPLMDEAKTPTYK